MIDQVVAVRERMLPGDLRVRRVLPLHGGRMVGPFAFLDELLPFTPGPGSTGDVPPHPHIGLATVTYLFEGEITHRDSLGSKQAILPGDVNWMTAGKGIAHSERIPDAARAGGRRMHGAQAWVALPLADEECEPLFEHYAAASLPRFDVEGVAVRLIAGSAFGRASPVRTSSRLFYFGAEAPEGASLSFDPEDQEAALYVLTGRVEIEGQELNGPILVTFKTGGQIKMTARSQTRALLLGGARLEGPRHIWWNFVSSSIERIDRAKAAWRERRFAEVPGETEFVPLP